MFCMNDGYSDKNVWEYSGGVLPYYEQEALPMQFSSVYYEPAALQYPLGKRLRVQFSHLKWVEIANHNYIEAMVRRENKDFPQLKRCLIVAVRKTHRYVENHKVSDYLVPFTSSGCTAMCLYCYLVRHYNKCAYLRLFVNPEQMLQKLLRTSQRSERPLTFEVGSNSDLVLENTITHNLERLIPTFAREGRGFLTFPTKFSTVAPLLPLEHQGKTIFRMSVNPQTIISSIELGTSPLLKRLEAVNQMYDAGYPVGILIAPVILQEGWKAQYQELFRMMEATLPQRVKAQMFFEVIFMTYSYVHRAINQAAFPHAPNLYRSDQMTGSGPGKYRYTSALLQEGEQWIRTALATVFPTVPIRYVC